MMSRVSLWRKNLGGLFLSVWLLSLSGCVYVVIGGVGALGGYVISPDTVEGVMTGRDYDEVWSAAKEVVSIMGVITDENKQGGVMLSKVHGTKVTITLFRASQTAVKLTVKARKSFLPKIQVAQEVYIKIENYLNQ
jgi:hypothetical protein